MLASGGHQVTGRKIVRDDPVTVRSEVHARAGTADAIITTNGTKITSQNSTYEAIASVLDKRLDGFSELFRMLSYQEIDTAAMLTRATAGSIGQTAVFMLPGSKPAVRLALSKLILPEIGHVVRELRR